MIRRAISLGLAFFPGAILAAPPDCTSMPDLGSTTVTLARVLPSARRVQFRTTPDCGDSAAGCVRRGYVVPGNELIVTARSGSRLCAVFVARNGSEFWGWLPAQALKVTTPAVTLADWAGRWTQTEASVAITTSGNRSLSIKGDATYGASSPDRVRRGAINIGNIEAMVTPTGNALDFAMHSEGGATQTVPWASAAEYDCAVRMKRVGPWLVVDDNNNCGGMNVTFRGIYQRTGRK
jgi:hypothetical protein